MNYRSSRKESAYNSYLEQFRATHTAPAPEYSNHRPVPSLAGAERLDAQIRAFNALHGGERYRLPDGRILELAPTSSGFSWTWAIFTDENHWRAFELPMSFNVYFEHW